MSHKEAFCRIVVRNEASSPKYDMVFQRCNRAATLACVGCVHTDQRRLAGCLRIGVGYRQIGSLLKPRRSGTRRGDDRETGVSFDTGLPKTLWKDLVGCITRNALAPSHVFDLLENHLARRTTRTPPQPGCLRLSKLIVENEACDVNVGTRRGRAIKFAFRFLGRTRPVVDPAFDKRRRAP